MSDPTIDCWNAAIALLSYMYNTRTLGLLYKRCGHVRLSVYCDSSYGASPKPMYCVIQPNIPDHYSIQRHARLLLRVVEGVWLGGCNVCLD